MIDDVLINKNETIKRCISRVNEEYQNNPENLRNYTKQDSIILNIQRLCEAAIDIAMHVVAELELGVPQNSRDAFEMLNQYQIIDSEMTDNLKAMVGFRNIAVHDYQKLNLKIVQSIIENEIKNISMFSRIILDFNKEELKS
ncbi:type VII toxin-antitoxin system HepT family RNase toxin [Selenihalanaerobacter shriftii]|uniref:Uncharacterized conserved protein YutE, UPF0331/DUF86 family n=1 Tax=Selenihalanaerobacter shriftii TaxID=142842 RepID=A0A1T4QI20_9FIRM|nr:DUF86 domain-containing protein [Selenihalanaerobacter shriftii]SKA03375.1 Uncharacterized conserved protein YutE, UPF0331/DUF86 family [Selenihalanaerobacter shriftii]